VFAEINGVSRRRAAGRGKLGSSRQRSASDAARPAPATMKRLNTASSTQGQAVLFTSADPADCDSRGINIFESGGRGAVGRFGSSCEPLKRSCSIIKSSGIWMLRCETVSRTEDDESSVCGEELSDALSHDRRAKDVTTTMEPDNRGGAATFNAVWWRFRDVEQALDSFRLVYSQLLQPWCKRWGCKQRSPAQCIECLGLYDQSGR
jgi:hypothetical protein